VSEAVGKLRDGIRDLLTAHPDVSVFDAGHTIHLERYVCINGEAFGHEAERSTKQNLWVRRDGIRFHAVSDIAHRVNTVEARKSGSKPNHHLFAIPAFKDADLVCFFPANLWDAARIILEVAGTGEIRT